MCSMPTDTHIHILLTHTYSTVNMRIPNSTLTHIHTRTCTHMAYTHAMHTQHAPYKHTYTHHTHIHNIHTYMHLNSGLSQNKACPKFRIINLPQKWNMYQFPYLTHYKHQHSATPTSTHQYPTHSHTDILPTGIPHNHPIHTNTHSSHTPSKEQRRGVES